MTHKSDYVSNPVAYMTFKVQPTNILRAAVSALNARTDYP